jgi:hypothetical protein
VHNLHLQKSHPSLIFEQSEILFIQALLPKKAEYQDPSTSEVRKEAIAQEVVGAVETRGYRVIERLSGKEFEVVSGDSALEKCNRVLKDSL